MDEGGAAHPARLLQAQDLQQGRRNIGQSAATAQFYGGAVAKYQHYPAGVDLASANVNRLNAVHVELKSKAENIQKMLQAASEEAKGMLNAELQKVNEEQKRIAGEIKAAAIQLKNATTAATAKYIVDIVVSEPVTIRVHPRKEQ